MALKTDYKNSALDTSVNPLPRYRMITNGDGTVSFEDVSTYTLYGDEFGAEDINATNEEINKITSSNVTGVKGNAESSYRGGNVNITPANIGAVNKAGDRMTGTLRIDTENGTESSTGDSFITIGNQKPDGRVGNSYGAVYLYSRNNKWGGISGLTGLTANRTYLIPDKDGTLALTDKADGSVATGVKGNAESSYRTGNVNLTPANVGAVDKAGDTMSGDLNIDKANGTAGTANKSYILLGNDKDISQAGHSYGAMYLYSNKQYFGDINGDVTLTANRYYAIPDKSGTLALTSDIPGVATTSANGLMSAGDKTKMGNIGVVESQSNTLSAASATEAKGTAISVSGISVVTARAVFQNNPNGTIRMLTIREGNTDYVHETVPPVTGNASETCLNVSIVTSGSHTFQAVVKQNSGATLSVTVQIVAVRISN